MIEFLCPNGHQIHCSDEQAGRAAKCPRCGVRFRIPTPEEAADTDFDGSDSQVSEPQLSDSGPVEAPYGAGGASEEEQIEFLCPNGHRLHGPPSLQGKPGQCPQCGSRFRVPVYEDVDDDEQIEEEFEEEIAVGRADGGAESGVALARLEEITDDEYDAELADAAARRGAVVHPLAELFANLWSDRGNGTTIELRLRDGETLVPDRFAPELSRLSHGVFAIKESSGTYTVTVVAWESVDRVLVHGVKELPKEMSN